MKNTARLESCPQCDHLVSRRATVCPQCGYRRKAEPNRRRPAVVMLSVVVVILAALWLTRSAWKTGRVSLTVSEVQVSPNDWPWWRGTAGDNRAVGEPPPTSWSQQQNVIWRTEAPGRGHASPILWGERIFLPTADDAQQTQSLLCFDRSSGQLLWTSEIHRGGFMHKSIKNSQASGTAACDGSRVFVPFLSRGALWLSAVDFQGEILWQKQVSRFESEHGYGSSPAIYKSLVIVAGDNLGPSFLTALDRGSGEIVWQDPRSSGGSYGTPVIATLAGRDQLLLSGQNSVISYDPQTGRRLWSCRGPADSTIGTIAWKDNHVFATAGAEPMRAGTMCIRADGLGDVSNSHVVWTADAKANVPSPLVVGDRVIVVQDGGIVTCLSAISGERLWRKRLSGNISASPVAAGELVFVPNEAGRLFVFKAGATCEIVAENDLGDGGFASPVICGGRLYLRSEHYLYCIGKRP